MATQTPQSDYAARSHRVSKEDLYMLLALFMEDFPLEPEEVEPFKQREEKVYKKAGAALVLPNDKIFAIDCTRNGVHGVARLLMEHQDVLKDCKVFVSRKPCSLCTKLLVQSKVKEVFYLPIEPEYHADEGIENYKDEEDMKECENEKLWVDELFRVSAISQKVFVPGAGLEKVVKNTQKYENVIKEDQGLKTLLMDKYWNEKWLENAKGKLPWPSFDDNMRKQINDEFHGIMEWAAKISLVGSQIMPFKFKRAEQGKQDGETLPSKQEEENVAFYPEKNEQGKQDGEKTSSKQEEENIAFDPEKNEQGKQDGETTPSKQEEENIAFDPEKNELECKQAATLITLARFLAERTDDPKTGVGAVIIDQNKKVVGLGWNGFPTKAVYGQFPRASDKDVSVQDKKYPYIIHAEQNALLMRNTKVISGGTLFVTKTPCNECTPLLEMQGIKTVVLGTKLQNEAKPSLDYKKFCEKVEKGVFTCFEMESASNVDDEPGI